MSLAVRFDVSEIHERVHNMVKIYPDFMRVYVFKETYDRRIEGFEEQNKKQKNSPSSAGYDTEGLERSLRRSKTSITDLTLCNKFDMFATFTFDTDRDDVEKSKQKMSRWLQSQKKRFPHLKYIIVPEFHKDGKSIHFHALISGFGGVLVEACKDTPKGMRYCNLKHKHKLIYQKGRILYNIKGYEAGFSTLAKIDNIQKVSSYVKKYITKDMPLHSSKKRYWCSMGLIRPYVGYNENHLDNPFLTASLTHETDGLAIFEIHDIVTPLNNKRGIKWQISHQLEHQILKSSANSKQSLSQVKMTVAPGTQSEFSWLPTIPLVISSSTVRNSRSLKKAISTCH